MCLFTYLMETTKTCGSVLCGMFWWCRFACVQQSLPFENKAEVRVTLPDRKVTTVKVAKNSTTAEVYQVTYQLCVYKLQALSGYSFLLFHLCRQLKCRLKTENEKKCWQTNTLTSFNFYLPILCFADLLSLAVSVTKMNIWELFEWVVLPMFRRSWCHTWRN